MHPLVVFICLGGKEVRSRQESCVVVVRAGEWFEVRRRVEVNRWNESGLVFACCRFCLIVI